MELIEFQYFTKNIDYDTALWKEVLGFKITHNQTKNETDDAGTIHPIKRTRLSNGNIDIFLIQGFDYTQDSNLTIRNYGTNRSISFVVDATEMQRIKNELARLESANPPIKFCVADTTWSRTIDGQEVSYSVIAIQHLRKDASDNCASHSNDPNALGVTVRIMVRGAST